MTAIHALTSMGRFHFGFNPPDAHDDEGSGLAVEADGKVVVGGN